MSFSFKQFSTFIDEATEDKSPQQLDEIFGRIFGKKPEENDALADFKKQKLLKQRNALLLQKAREEDKRKILRKTSDEQWTKAKHEIEGRMDKIKPIAKIGRKDDYPFHHMHTESKARVKNPGFFTMADTRKINQMDLENAKAYLLNKIDSIEGARPANIAKATRMVNKANTVKKLMIDVSNFILAHETENLKVI